jgi:hypothetical protein
MVQRYDKDQKTFLIHMTCFLLLIDIQFGTTDFPSRAVAIGLASSQEISEVVMSTSRLFFTLLFKLRSAAKC